MIFISVQSQGAVSQIMEHSEPAPVRPPQAAPIDPVVAGKTNTCWPAAEMQGSPTDKTIVKDTPKAIVEPPRDPLAKYSPNPPGAIRRVELPKGDNRIAFTFDNCEQPYEVAGYDAEIVNVLRANRVRATFFAGGKWMMTHAERTQQLLSDPLFEVGNHSWEHRNLRLLEGQRQIDEIRWAQAAYERQAKAFTKRQCVREGKSVVAPRMDLFRFPFGACNPAALDAVAKLGLLPIQWDISSGDPSRTLSPEIMAAAVVRQVRPGSIVLFHANGRGWSTAAALKIMIPQLRAKGFEFATVGDLLRTEGATFKRDAICYDSKPGDVDRHDALARRLDDAYQKFYARHSSKPAASVDAPTAAPVIPPPPVPARRPAQLAPAPATQEPAESFGPPEQAP